MIYGKDGEVERVRLMETKVGRKVQVVLTLTLSLFWRANHAWALEVLSESLTGQSPYQNYHGSMGNRKNIEANFRKFVGKGL